MSARILDETKPFLSVCIPHYNRSPHLELALRVLASQTDRDLEVCISDDGSSDDPDGSIERWLSTSGMAYRLVRQSLPLRYDANLRYSIGMARGRYVLLMGNDDSLIDAGAVARLRSVLHELQWPEVLVADYADWQSRIPARRVRQTGVVGAGTAATVSQFRNLSFVSGLVFDRVAAQAAASDEADGSEMYQMYLLARVMRPAARMATLADVLVLKDIQVPGVHVDSHRDEPRDAHCSFQPRPKPMCRIPQVIQSGVLATGEVSDVEIVPLMTEVCGQLYRYTYPYWLMRFRELRGICHTIGFARALDPTRACHDVLIGTLARWRLRGLICLATLACIVVPPRAFHRVRPYLYRIAKS